MKKIIALLLIPILYLLFSTDVNAQSLSLSLSPSQLEIVSSPGKSITLFYNLQNLGDPTYAKLQIFTFESKDNLGNIKLGKSSGGQIRFNLIDQKLKLDDNFLINSQEKKQILLNLAIPDNTQEDDYYYTFVVESQPQSSQNNGSLILSKAQISSNLLVTVTKHGVIDIKPQVVLFAVPGVRIFEPFSPIPLQFIIKNNGRNFFKPQGEILLSGLFGTKTKYSILPRNILADSQRLMLTTSSSAKKEPSTLVLKHLLPGFYKLGATVNFGPGSPTVYASASFLVFPVKLLIIILIILSLTVFFIHKKKSQNAKIEKNN